jgi:hypothetical protein
MFKITRNAFLALGIVLVLIGALLIYHGYGLCRNPSSCISNASIDVMSTAQGNISDALVELGFAIVMTPIILYLLFKEEIK